MFHGRLNYKFNQKQIIYLYKEQGKAEFFEIQHLLSRMLSPSKAQEQGTCFRMWCQTLHQPRSGSTDDRCGAFPVAEGPCTRSVPSDWWKTKPTRSEPFFLMLKQPQQHTISTEKLLPGFWVLSFEVKITPQAGADGCEMWWRLCKVMNEHLVTLGLSSTLAGLSWIQIQALSCLDRSLNFNCAANESAKASAGKFVALRAPSPKACDSVIQAGQSRVNKTKCSKYSAFLSLVYPITGDA